MYLPEICCIKLSSGTLEAWNNYSGSTWLMITKGMIILRICTINFLQQVWFHRKTRLISF
ncbi:MAG TPA: hypothetical protein DCL73_04055 [Treponema sp.]|nr:hypothetical protein [Treponema sp.]